MKTPPSPANHARSSSANTRSGKRPGARKPSAKAKSPKLSRTLAPQGMSPEQWQIALRQQYGKEQHFGLENLGTEPVFSEFAVHNPETNSRYRVKVRGLQAGDNHCTCMDFATNELGTCKHIAFVLSKLQAKRGVKKRLAQGFRPAYSELVLRQHQGVRAVYWLVGLDCPPRVLQAAQQLFGLALPPSALAASTLPSPCRLLPQPGQHLQHALQSLNEWAKLCSQLGHALQMDQEVKNHLASLSDAEHRAQVLQAVYPPAKAAQVLQKLIKVPLYPYQVEGALFAARAGRALIADDMGLGKTIQAIAAAELLGRHFGVTRVLVVCPTSLKYQWQKEIERFVGRQARVIGGGRGQRQGDYAQEDFFKITNYETLRSDLDLVALWAPELVIVDEAQRVKNWNTIAARALKRIDSAYAIVLTGTPLENKLEELISIVQFVDQHRLGPTWKLLYEHQLKDEAGRVIGYTGLEDIGRTLAPLMIRRRKSEVLRQLPPRTDQNLFVPLTEAQAALHQENAVVVTQIVNRWRKTKYLSDKDQRRLTCALQNMRMVCNSTYLLDPSTDHGVKADELMALLDGVLADPQAKVVVFSQWVRSHDILIPRLQQRAWGHVSFHGSVRSEVRPQLVEQFRQDPACRVFLSTDAGAVGLNLQHASTVVNLDLPWNPALLEQRIGRVYRMGQKRPVRVINFISKGSIEEGMLSVLAFKRSLAAGILDGAENEISLGGSRLTRFMKEVENVANQTPDSAPMAANEELAATALQEQVDASESDADHPLETARPPEPVYSPHPTTPATSADTEPLATPATAPLAQATVQDPPEAPSQVPSQFPQQAPLQDPLQDLLQAHGQPLQTLLGVGLQWLSTLAAQAANPAPTGAPRMGVVSDPVSGERYLKLPAPEPEVMDQVASALDALARALRGK